MKIIKMIGLSAIVAVALTATAAPAAQASPEFHCKNSGTSKCMVENGWSSVVLTTTTGPVACNLKVQGTMPVDAPSLTVSPWIQGCKMWGVKAAVSVNDCTLRFTPSGESSPYSTGTDIICPAEKAITLAPVGIACTVTIGAQSSLQGVTMAEKNVPGSYSTVETNLGLNGITYTETGAECPTPGTHSNGKLSGTLILKAYEEYLGAFGEQRSLRLY